MEIGSLAWARKTGGKINFQEKLLLAYSGVTGAMKDIPPLLWWKMGLPMRQPLAVDLASIQFPETKATKSAESLLNELTPAFMVNHSIRTYVWSRLLGDSISLECDNELLYIASLLHDIGFYGPYAKSTPKTECFSIRSDDAALQIAEKNNWSSSRRDQLAEAIILNANLHVPLTQGAEAHIMQKGVSVDIMGTGIWKISRVTKDSVISKFPRLDQSPEIWNTWKAEADRHVCCRGHFYNQFLQFKNLLKLAPFD